MKKMVLILLHVLIVITTVWAVADYFISGPDALGSQGVGCFKYFTTDSNVLAALASLLWLIRGRTTRPGWLTRLQLAGTVAVQITLLTVVFFLVPMSAGGPRGWSVVWSFFERNVFVLHLSTPVLALAAWLMDDRDPGLRLRDMLWSLIPMTLYGTVYIIQVVTDGWKDFYGFTFGGRLQLIPLVMAVMFVFNWLLSLAVWRLGLRCGKSAGSGK